jgi:hypothetical protein
MGRRVATAQRKNRIVITTSSQKISSKTSTFERWCQTPWLFRRESEASRYAESLRWIAPDARVFPEDGGFSIRTPDGLCLLQGDFVGEPIPRDQEVRSRLTGRLDADEMEVSP